MSREKQWNYAISLLQGFGIGLSWGACITNFKNTTIIKPTIYGE